MAMNIESEIEKDIAAMEKKLRSEFDKVKDTRQRSIYAGYFSTAVQGNDFDAVDMLISKLGPAALDQRLENGHGTNWSLLNETIRLGTPEMLEHLLAVCDPPKLDNKLGYYGEKADSPLLIAAKFGQTKMMDILVNRYPELAEKETAWKIFEASIDGMGHMDARVNDATAIRAFSLLDHQKIMNNEHERTRLREKYARVIELNQALQDLNPPEAPQFPRLAALIAKQYPEFTNNKESVRPSLEEVTEMDYNANRKSFSSPSSPKRKR